MILSWVNQYQIHVIANITTYSGFDSHDPFKDDLAVLHVKNLPFNVNNSPNREIELHDGYVPSNAVGTFRIGMYQWIRASCHVNHLNFIWNFFLPKIIYCGYSKFTGKEFCTHDASELKFIGFGDLGGPQAFDDFSCHHWKINQKF